MAGPTWMSVGPVPGASFPGKVRHHRHPPFLRAVVWANGTQLGTRYGVTIVRLFKLDGEATWRTSPAFNRDDLPLVAKVADLAHTHIFGLVQHDTPF